MVSRLLLGSVVGAVGTLALDVITYGDEVWRGRGSSDTPAKVAGVLLDKLAIQLPSGGQETENANSNRRAGLGALMGYGTGVLTGTVYGLIRPQVRGVPWPLMGVVLGLAAMAASDTPIAATDVSNPSEWSSADWLTDLVPHLGYGLVTAGVYELLGQDGRTKD